MRTTLAAIVASTALALAALSTPSVADATVVVQLSTDSMTRLSDVIVRARVIAQSSAWSQDHAQIVTLTQLEVTGYLKGTGPTALVLRQFGGTVGDVHAIVPGDGAFTVGEECILFLHTGVGVVYLTALAQSVYHIDSANAASPMVSRDLSDLTFARRTPSGISIVGAGPVLPTAEPLDALVAEVLAAVGGAR